MKGSELAPSESVAAVLDRLAMLLSGGTAPATAWGLLASHASRSDRESRAVVQHVARAVASGGDAAEVLRGHESDGWRALGCAWALAGRTGAPLARSLGGLAGGFRDAGAAERDIGVALAGPTSTSRVVLALPLVGLGLGVLMGVNVVAVLVGTPFGLACAAIGAVLMASGWGWMRALVRRASVRDPHPGLALELVALGMRGGGAAQDVAAAVSRAMREFGLHDAAAASIPSTLALAAEAGVPPAQLLQREASLARTIARAAGQRQAAQLGVRLMLPLGVCILPAFIALGVAPLVLSILGDVLSPLSP